MNCKLSKLELTTVDSTIFRKSILKQRAQTIFFSKHTIALSPYDFKESYISEHTIFLIALKSIDNYETNYDILNWHIQVGH